MSDHHHHYLCHLILGGESPFTTMRAEEIFRQFFGDMDLGSIFGQEHATSTPHQVWNTLSLIPKLSSYPP